jgi:hypothetical protein
MASEKTPQDFFMRIENPKLFRRNLLESSKEVLSILKQIYSIKRIREQKKELVTLMNKEIKEITLLFDKLEDALPKHSKEELEKQFPQLKKEKPKPVKTENSSPKEEKKSQKKTSEKDSELDKLSRALDDVQNRLNTL